MLKDYLNNRRLVYTTDRRVVTISLTSGVSQKFILRPTLWNILYDKLLREQMPYGVEILAFADDVAIVAKSVVTTKVGELLEESTETTLKWFDIVGLELAI